MWETNLGPGVLNPVVTLSAGSRGPGEESHPLFSIHMRRFFSTFYSIDDLIFQPGRFLVGTILSLRVFQ